MHKKQALQIIRTIRKNYNTIAPDWDKSRFFPSAIKIKMLKSIKLGLRVLDIGCGNGFILPEVVKRKGRYDGIDISENLIKIAKKKFARQIRNGLAKFVVGNALDLPYKNQSFDVVLSFAVLHHIPSQELRIKFLKEVKRVLKKGSSASIIVWNLENKWAREKFNIEVQLKKTEAGLESGDVYVDWRAIKGKVIKRYIHVFKKQELTDIIRAAGFTKFKIDYYTRQGVKKRNGEEAVICFRN